MDLGPSAESRGTIIVFYHSADDILHHLTSLGVILQLPYILMGHQIQEKYFVVTFPCYDKIQFGTLHSVLGPSARSISRKVRTSDGVLVF